MTCCSIMCEHTAASPFTAQYPDADATYCDRRTIDLATMEPLIALPDSIVKNTVPVGQVAGQAIQQAFIGSCANGTLDDFAIAAGIDRRPTGRAGSAADHDAGLAANLSRRAAGWLCGDARGSGCAGNQLDLRRLRRRAHGRRRPGRNLHHREPRATSRAAWAIQAPASSWHRRQPWRRPRSWASLHTPALMFTEAAA